jgi:hypothetical protein
MLALTAALSLAAGAFAAAPQSPSPGALAVLRRGFLGADLRTELPGAGAAELDVASYEELAPLRAQAAFVEAGRFEDRDDWPAYADMVVAVAARLGVDPPESALELFRGRVRPPGAAPTAEESRARAALLAEIADLDFSKRYLYIPGLVDSPPPPLEAAAPPPAGRKKRGARRAPRAPELAPPPPAASVVGRIDWDKTDELADVADDNARNWDRRAGESARRYARRLRRLRKHCYEWVRRDIAALGLWDDELFRGPVAATRRDPKRPIRAASFALAMAKVSAAGTLAARTPLRELNLRVDPIVRGAILVFSQSACGYDRRSGHIEIVTSVVPLRAASYKFHDVASDCLVRASAQNKIHVYVPLRLDEPAPEEKKG